MAEFLGDISKPLTLWYRITGPQAIDRVTPLLRNVNAEFNLASDYNDEALELAFVWETTCEISWKEFHKHALCINRLHNTQVMKYYINIYID